MAAQEAPGTWGGGSSPTAPLADFLDFFSGDMWNADALDNETLAAVTAADAGTSCGKVNSRPRETVKAEDGDDSGPESEDSEERPASKRARKGKSHNAAQSKANREKARREKVNDRFSELAQALEETKEVRTDKLSILNDAIKFVQQMRVENNQLKQMLKYCETHVKQLEEDKKQMVYQQHMMQQMLQQCQMLGYPGQAGMMAPQPSMLMTPAGMGGMQCLTMPALQRSSTGMDATASGGAAAPATAAGTPVGVQFASGAMMMADKQAVPMQPSMFMSGIPGWVPPDMLDADRDSQLRPPAA